MPVTSEDTQERLKKLIDKVTGLPTLPQMFETLNRMLVNPRTSAKDVAQVISTDPSIASKVLKVVNSPFYGFPSRIATITHAIVILGFNTIKSIVLSSTIFDIFKKDTGDAEFNYLEFWKHSIGVGASARVISRMVGMKEQEEAFIAGLLHDVGKLVILQYMPEKAKEIMAYVRANNCLISQAEEKVLGVTHAEVGAWLGDRWNLAKGLVDVCRFHHNPALSSQFQKMCSIVHLADIITRAVRVGSGGDRKIPNLSESAWRTLNLREQDFDRMIGETFEEIEKAVVYLDFIK